MATYRIKSADGSKTYNVTLPDPAPGEAAPQQPYSGQLLPFSKDAQGNVSFDINAGIPGVIKRAVEFPADAMRGKVDPLSDEGIGRAAETALIFNPVPAATRAGIGWAGVPVKGKPVKPIVPSASELKDTGGFGFDMARGMDVRYAPSAVQNMALKMRSELHNAGFRESNAPTVFAELKALGRPVEPGAFASIDDLHAIRMALSKAARPNADGSNATEVEAATRFIRAIDDFITRPDPKAVVAGPAASAANVWKDAMGNYAAGKRSDKLMGLEQRADRRASAANSGLNIDNAIRQRVASLLENPKLSGGFSPEEIKMLESVVDGTATRNTLRWFGNLLGGGGGFAAAVVGGGTGAYYGGLSGLALGASVPAAGLAAKLAGNRMTKNALRKVDETVRQRSPIYQERVANPQMSPAPASMRALPGRAVGAEVGAGVTQPTPNSSPIDPRVLSIIKALGPVDERQYDQYLKQKWAPNQGA